MTFSGGFPAARNRAFAAGHAGQPDVVIRNRCVTRLTGEGTTTGAGFAGGSTNFGGGVGTTVNGSVVGLAVATEAAGGTASAVVEPETTIDWPPPETIMLPLWPAPVEQTSMITEMIRLMDSLSFLPAMALSTPSLRSSQP